MIPPRPTALLHTLLRDALGEGDTVIDATAGNGHDTLFLAGCVGASGRVLAFDIQPAAIRSASARIAAAGLGERVVFHQESHIRMPVHASPSSIAAIVFNLGYLPGENHTVTTVAEETQEALAAAAPLIRPGGVLAVVCYPGHPEGAIEAVAVENWMMTLDPGKWRVARYGVLGTQRPAPFLLLAGRGKERRAL